MLRCAQHDSQDSGQGSPSPLTGEVLSPNVCTGEKSLTVKKEFGTMIKQSRDLSNTLIECQS